MSQDGQVQTARGPVAAAGLGQVLMHEHVFVLTAEVQQNYPEEWGTRTSGSPTPSAACASCRRTASPPSSTSPPSARAGTSRGSSGSPSRCPS